MAIKVLIADDHQLIRQGFRALLSAETNFEIIAEAANGREVINHLKVGMLPDIILMDIEMPELDGLQATKILRKDHPNLKIIMLTMLNDRAVIESALDSGAQGYLFKDSSLNMLKEAIEEVYKGNQFLGNAVAQKLLTKKYESQNFNLSDRELEVLRLIVEGHSSSEIGEKLFISPRTVDTHRNNLIQKLEVKGIAGLIRFAMENRLT